MIVLVLLLLFVASANRRGGPLSPYLYILYVHMASLLTSASENQRSHQWCSYIYISVEETPQSVTYLCG